MDASSNSSTINIIQQQKYFFLQILSLPHSSTKYDNKRTIDLTKTNVTIKKKNS